MLSRRQELRQVGALPLFLDAGGGVDVCLVTSRGGGRWIIPKGNPIPGLAPHEVAAREALEEAGLIGVVTPRCIGSFEVSRRRAGRDMTCLVEVYPLRIERQLRTWAEANQRSVRRCNLDTARSLVCSPGLVSLIERYLALEPSLRRSEP